MLGCARLRGNIVEIKKHAPGAAERITSGEVSWFDVEHGGYLWVTRMLLTGPAWGGAEMPSDQWSAGTVSGLPAAIGGPMAQRVLLEVGTVGEGPAGGRRDHQ